MARRRGAKRLSEIFAAIPASAGAAGESELSAQASALVGTMRGAVRKGRTLKLMNSIVYSKTRGRQLSYKVQAGGAATTKPVRQGQSATYDYALGVEHGNRQFGPGVPFFFPSYRKRRKKIASAVIKKMKAGIAKVVLINSQR